MGDLVVGVVIGQRGCLDGRKLIEQLRRKVLLLRLRLLRLRPKREGSVLGFRILGLSPSCEKSKPDKKEIKVRRRHDVARVESSHGRWSVYLSTAPQRNSD